MIPARLRGWAAGVAATFVLLYLLAPVDRLRPERILVVAVLLAAVLGVRRELTVRPRPDPRWDAPPETLGPPPELAQRLARTRGAVEQAVANRAHYDGTLRPLLRELAEQRLAAGHGIVLVTQPERARQVLGEELWQMVSAPPGGAPPRPDEVAALVERLRAL